jgi:hypothetical protein
MLPVVNPYRNEQGRAVSGDKHKSKKGTSSMVSTRATFLGVLLLIVVGTYYLHLKYFASIQRKPSVRGGNTYRSFSDSVKEFATDMQHDLQKLDDTKNSVKSEPIEVRQPPRSNDARGGKVKSVLIENSLEPKPKKEKVPAAPVSREGIAPTKPAAGVPEKQLAPEVLQRIYLEKHFAGGVEDKVKDLAEQVKKTSDLPKLVRTPPPIVKTVEPAQDGPHILTVTGPREVPPKPQTKDELGEKKPERREPDKRLVAEGHAGEKAAKEEAANRPEPAAEQSPAAQKTGEKDAQSAPDKPKAEGGALQALVADRMAHAEPAVPVPLTLPNITLSERDLHHDADSLHAVRPAEIHLDSPHDAADHANADALGQEESHPAAQVREMPPEAAGEQEAVENAEEDPALPTHDLPPVVPHAGTAGHRLGAPPIEPSTDTPKEHPPGKIDQRAETPPPAAAAAADGARPAGWPAEPVEQLAPPVIVTTTANNRPTGYDLPDLKTVSPTGADPKADGAEKPKIDYCAGQVDPFQGIPVDTFTPPAAADYKSVSQWRSEVKSMIGRVSKVRYGGEDLRQLMRTEVEALQVLRFKLFCEYA